MVAKLWNKNEIEAEQEVIAAELAGLEGDDPDAHIKHLVTRLNQMQATEDGPGKLVNILAILRIHARYRVLSKTDFKRFFEMARYILVDKKLFVRSSRLSFLAAELNQIESEMAFADGHLLQACWLAESGAALAEEDSGCQVARGNSLARAGQIHAAIAVYRQVAASTGSYQAEASWQLIRCLRMAGKLDEAHSLYLDFFGSVDERGWFPLTCSLQRNLDFAHFVRQLRTRNLGALDLLYGKAWLYAGGKRSLYDELPTVDTLRRKLSKTDSRRFGPFVDALGQIETAYQDGQTLHARMSEAARALSRLSQMPSCEEELLILAAILRFLLKFRQYSHARFIVNEYYSLCLKLSEAASKDCLGMMGDVRIDTIARKAQGGRSVTVTALRTLTKGAAVVTSSRLRALAAGPDEADRLKQNELERLSELLAEAFGSLKGGMMKVGQILSLIAEYSPQFRNPLRRLQFDAQPSSEAEAAAVFAAEFGQNPDEEFFEWEAEPVALGSIGQVYCAKLADQREVAVKIQHKDIEKSLRQDLRLLTLVKPVIRRMFPAANASALITEIKDQLLMEVDYIQEADFQCQFRRYFAGHPDIIVPMLIPEYCKERVITCEFIKGIPFDTFCKTASAEARNRAGRAIATMFYQSLFGMGLFNCDPHPNNYLFMEDGRTVFLDFGCVKQFKPDFIDALRLFTLSAVSGDVDQHFASYLKLGYFRSDDPVDAAACLRIGKIAAEPILADKEFTIDRAYVRRVAETLYLSNLNLKRYLVPPVDSVMLVRFTFGLLTVLAELQATANWHRIFMDLKNDLPQPGQKTVETGL